MSSKKFFKKKNKKAQFFSISIILIISLMFVSFELFSLIHERGVIKTRVSTMDSFLNSIEDNLEKQIYIAGFRIIFLAENYIIDTGKYIGESDNYTGIEDFFQEAFLQGTVSGVEQYILFTYTDLADSLQEKADKMNLEIILENPPKLLNISQEDPWNVNFTVGFDLTMEDKENLAKWERFQVISVLIPVTGFSDPLYNVETYNKVPRLIEQTPYEGDYVDGDKTNLISHIDNGYYAANSDAPNFLMRLEGNFSANPSGIESFVIRPDLSKQGLPTTEKSCIDYIYFSSNSPPYSSVSGVYESWFRIDDGHRTKYGV